MLGAEPGRSRLRWVNILTATDHHVLDAIFQVDIAFFVLIAGITRMYPAIGQTTGSRCLQDYNRCNILELDLSQISPISPCSASLPWLSISLTEAPMFGRPQGAQ